MNGRMYLFTGVNRRKRIENNSLKRSKWQSPSTGPLGVKLVRIAFNWNILGFVSSIATGYN